MASSSWFKLSFTLACLLFVGCWGSEQQGPSGPLNTNPAAKTNANSVNDGQPKEGVEQKVGFFVDFGKVREQIRTEVAWVKGMTAISVIESAKPAISCDYKGSGASCFLNSIAGVKNDFPAKKYWIYYVNGKQGTVGAGVCELKPGDKVLWRFGSDAIE